MHLVLVGDGASSFDELIADIGFNDAGSVLTMGSGSVLALDLSATAISWDVNLPTVSPPLPPPPVTLIPIGLTPVAPFASSVGGFGYYTFPGAYPTVGAGVMVTAAGFAVTAVGLGTREVEPLPLPGPGGGTLFLASGSVPTSLLGATVIVVPEPVAGALLLFGLSVLAVRGRRGC